MILNHCVFFGNTASNSGGGMYDNNSSSPRLENCVFVSNSSEIYGGGLCHFSNGVGLGTYTSTLTLINCDFVANFTKGYGSGAYVNARSLAMTNSIVWGNSLGLVYEPDSKSSTDVADGAHVNHCDIQGGFEGEANIDADPQFVRSPWTGPDGVYGTADDDLGDLRLRAGSPALDSGSNATIASLTDIAGLDRIQNGNVDMGAYEGLAAAPAPKVLYVDIASNGDNNGSSWWNAYTNLQTAILKAADGDTIKIAQGTYYPTQTTDRTATFALKSNVAIQGGYLVNGIMPNPVTYPTILSGDIGVLGNSSDNSYHVVTSSVNTSSTLLKGVYIMSGNADGSGTYQDSGGGMLCLGSVLKLEDCFFINNTAASNGGGLFIMNAPTKIIKSRFFENSASTGGGIYANGNAPEIYYSAIAWNTATKNGGGIYQETSRSHIINCTLFQNTAANGGGLMNAYAFNSYVTNCIIWGNSTGIEIGSSDIGGGTGSSSGEVTEDTSDHFDSKLFVTYCDIQNGYPGTGNINAIPLFFQIPSKGNDGVWGTIDDQSNPFPLKVVSPCNDAGINSAVPIELARFDDISTIPDTGNGTAPIVDIGCMETLAPMSFQGTVFNDRDSDGVKDKNEKGVANVKVFLDRNFNWKRDSNELIATTNSSGKYIFKNVDFSTYRVVLNKMPDGFHFSAPDNNFVLCGLGAGVSFTGYDFYITQAVKVSGTVFIDANKNKKQDSSEKGIKSRRVFVDANNNSVWDNNETSVMTDSNGNFSLNLDPGKYALRVTPAKGFRFTTPSKGVWSLRVQYGKNISGISFGLSK